MRTESLRVPANSAKQELVSLAGVVTGAALGLEIANRLPWWGKILSLVAGGYSGREVAKIMFPGDQIGKVTDLRSRAYIN